MSKKIELPSVLAFERKLEISDGLMYAGRWSNRDTLIDEKTKEKLWQPITVGQRQNRSTQSAFGIDDIKKTMPNPVASGDDQAVIPSGCDTLKVSWTLRIIGKVGTPFSCNKSNFETAIKEKTESFKDQSEFKELANRYAYNIANGRFLWRNRVCAESVTIKVTIKDGDEPLSFDAYDFSLNDFKKNKNDENLKNLANHIHQGLADKTGEKFTSIKVNAFVKLDESQQVFPSQEMNMNQKGKALFKLDKCAALHNVKIGNAIRTIDTWYSSDIIVKAADKNEVACEKLKENDKTPIAIEPYGSVTQRGMAYRATRDDLYTLMMNWVNEKEITDSDKNYIIANLIRGGVFGGK